MGYVYLAKGDGKLFLILEVIMGVVILTMNLLLYYFYGLNGLGVSFILTYMLGVIISFFVLKHRYEFRLPHRFLPQFFIQYGFLLLTFATCFFKNDVLRYTSGAFVFAIALALSYRRLNELLDFKSFFASRFEK